MGVRVGRLSSWALIMGGLVLAPVSLAITAVPVAAAEAPKPTLSPQVGTILKQANDLAQQKKFKEAIAKVAETDAIADKTPFDVLTIAQVRDYLYRQVGDYTSAGDALQTALSTGLLSPEDTKKTMHDIVILYYNGNADAKAVAAAQAYIAKYGDDDEMLLVIADSGFRAKDYANSAQAAEKYVRSLEAKGHKPNEEVMKIWVVASLNAKNQAAYAAALYEIVANYPKPEYWHDALINVGRQAGFNDKLKIDLFDLRLTTGALRSGEEFVEMAQRALKDNLPAYAQRALEAGFAAKLVADTPANKQLLATATSRAANEKLQSKEEVEARGKPTGQILANLAAVAESYGNHAHAAELYREAIGKGGLDDADAARLRLGAAQVGAGQVDAAKATLGLVKGKNGATEIAKYWLLYAKAPAPAQ